MNRLKNENVKKCFALLEEFIDEACEETGKKGRARLVLEQLQKITAGTNNPDFPVNDPGVTVNAVQCYSHPRADLTPGSGTGPDVPPIP